DIAGAKHKYVTGYYPSRERDDHQVTALSSHILNGTRQAGAISLDSKRTKANIPEQVAMNTPL
ncbi:hypothetical protein, partial [Aeromonas hydrophila]|uniref:hypothetical protein n=1 Tax=Aeromonas hydrophila TaxID=644 RepID=UPI003F66277B